MAGKGCSVPPSLGEGVTWLSCPGALRTDTALYPVRCGHGVDS